MTNVYKNIGDYISVVDKRNLDGKITKLMGISIDKCYIPSVANVIGTDLHNYKIIRKGQFACSLMQVSRDQRIPIAKYSNEVPAIMSPAYVLFEVSRPDEILPEFMELWFKRAEFDREATFYAIGGVRGSLDWEDFCRMKLPIPPISVQRKIVHDYQVIAKRIEILREISATLEELENTIFIETCLCADNDCWESAYFGDFIEDSAGGDWGLETPDGNYNSKVICIRGADIPGVNTGIISDAPVRFILERNALAKKLSNNDMIVEISGGSPIQSTGRIALITDEIVRSLHESLICSNFCKSIKVQEDYLYFFYLYWRYLYKKGRLFDYENSTIALKNFDFSSFTSQESIKCPPIDVSKRLNVIIEPIQRSIIKFGTEIRQLDLLKKNMLQIMLK